MASPLQKPQDLTLNTARFPNEYGSVAAIRPIPKNTQREAFVLAVVEEGPGEFFLVLGSGDHGCDRWKLTPSLLRKLSIESFNLAAKVG